MNVGLSADFFYIILTIVSGALVIVGTGIYIVLVKIFNKINELQLAQAVDSKTVSNNEKAIERIDKFSMALNKSLHDHKNEMHQRLGMLEFKVNYEDSKKDNK